MLDALSLTRQDLAKALPSLGLSGAHASSVFFALHRRLCTTFAAIPTMSVRQRELLEAKAGIVLPRFAAHSKAADGAEKYLFAFEDKAKVESVWIPQKTGTTVCISSQAGCALGCSFCATGAMGPGRNLLPSEIVAQVYTMLRDHPGESCDGIVFMGMGEPFLNYRNVMDAIGILTDRQGQSFAARDITVSTAGIPQRIAQFGRESKCNLAISLHATTDQLRTRLMPINQRYPIAEVMEACQRVPHSKRRPIMFEYLLLSGVNDGMEDAARLAKLLGGVHALVNLIPYNPVPGAQFRAPRPSQALAFKDALRSAGLKTFIRAPRGQDISAACGMLSASKKHSSLPVVQGS